MPTPRLKSAPRACLSPSCATTYVENIAGAIEHAKATGVLSLPGVNGRDASLTRADGAAAVAGALVGEGHANKS